MVASGPERIILPMPQPLLYSGINAVNTYFLSTSVPIPGWSVLRHNGDSGGPSLGIMALIVQWGRHTCPWTTQSRPGRDKEAQRWHLASACEGVREGFLEEGTSKMEDEEVSRQRK